MDRPPRRCRSPRACPAPPPTAAARACRPDCPPPACGPRCARPGSAPPRRRGSTASRRACPCPRRPTGRRSRSHWPSGYDPPTCRARPAALRQVLGVWLWIDCGVRLSRTRRVFRPARPSPQPLAKAPPPRYLAAMDIPRFHLAFPVRDLAEARAFYGGLLGCPEGRSSEEWIDFDFHGHQIVAHLAPDEVGHRATNPVD